MMVITCYKVFELNFNKASYSKSYSPGRLVSFETYSPEAKTTR